MALFFKTLYSCRFFSGQAKVGASKTMLVQFFQQSWDVGLVKIKLFQKESIGCQQMLQEPVETMLLLFVWW